MSYLAEKKSRFEFADGETFLADAASARPQRIFEDGGARTRAGWETISDPNFYQSMKPQKSSGKSSNRLCAEIGKKGFRFAEYYFRVVMKPNGARVYRIQRAFRATGDRGDFSKTENDMVVICRRVLIKARLKRRQKGNGSRRALFSRSRFIAERLRPALIRGGIKNLMMCYLSAERTGARGNTSPAAGAFLGVTRAPENLPKRLKERIAPSAKYAGRNAVSPRYRKMIF
jgi:hypothetical protein